MGSAMLDGWLARGLDPRKLTVIEPQPANSVKALRRRGVLLNPAGKPTPASAVVIAVKPQSAPEAVASLVPFVGRSTLAVSIMAGRPLGFLEQALPPDTAIVRSMPNTPAAIGRGITVACPNAKVTPRQRKLASDLLAAIGTVEWVGDESLMDAVTAVSGSGPAYVFLLAEALAQAGIAAGLPQDLAVRLARETVTGSGELLHQSPLDAATLAPERHLARRHDRGGARGTNGPGRTGAAHGSSRRRRNCAIARTRRLILPGSSVSSGMLRFAMPWNWLIAGLH